MAILICFPQDVKGEFVKPLTSFLMAKTTFSTSPLSRSGFTPSSTSLIYWFSSGCTHMYTGMLYLRRRSNSAIKQGH